MGTCEKKEGHLHCERAIELNALEQLRRDDHPTTAEMQSEICRHYPDGYEAKQATMDIWRDQGRVLTFATAIELHYSQLVKDVVREAELLIMYAKKRKELRK